MKKMISVLAEAGWPGNPYHYLTRGGVIRHGD